MNILVCGGAGYIGSHVVRQLQKKGYEVLVLDNLINGHLSAVDGVPFVKADITDKQALQEVFSRNSIDAVMHFAAFSIVGESMSKPGLYYRNNVLGTLNLLEAMRENKVSKLIFSSTAAVYGEPEEIPICEEHRTKPTNPYGATKLAVEEMLNWFNHAYGLNYVSLRYFNAAGADESGDIGEDHNPETHLIPLVLKTALGVLPEIKIFGTDYPTPDGTCLRDYIHVNDLADAHIMGLQSLSGGGQSTIFNLGNGNGFSVKEIIETARKVTGKPIQAVETDRRTGDPAVLVASSEKIKQELGWQPRYGDIEQIISSAWRWHQRNFN
ncbi:UDP-glucose 4-epimerase [Desulfofarcimen acetoxidans DSM 771]|uniref:UDP-glucose 4-epimerase n=1 Tax=Desulfofarcimen acetoxidans (strain ATCC 49208 / DSM 771 / KCTC 5769 / VKM B-1644 / 5575) TaxID=485916 RepID=C8W003_DESAS|nr:UDP-glucose 4-epimerase GalE [Desulfofarcimen acetoxidans]ACV64971.1 UDP-glucose 4-epimerase [Desulfofarcimen acetoxidans DSM 771]